jgi:Uma2 family endonuclease
VRSPSHRHTFTAQKIQQYLTHGTLLVLDIDPYARKVYAHTSATAAPTIYGSGERFSCEVLPWLQFDVAELFAKIKIPR